MILRESIKTEVFINANGYIAIVQQEEAVCLTPDQALAIASELLRLVEKKGEWWVDPIRDEVSEG